ncbi:MAG TPA: class I SAM-dependent methyltransferase [Nitrospirae bacterium]|nr:trans-aconitate 2-methyltransferase [bacterium BMS3Abin06]HDH10818.1 class I SAM-dependent methyltransferase [Nitrospirota bacterium]HDZ00938.1 class I SAM-dependent methyltransferase [Nitrospirota bacterium]
MFAGDLANQSGYEQFTVNPLNKMNAAYINNNKSYYQANKQAEDRIALSLYYRLATSFVKTGKVLDFGCGTGHFIKRFKDGYETWAYDVSPYALGSVRAIAPNANICSSPEALNELDLVVSVHVMEHLKDPFETLRLFHKILHDGGVLLYIVPDVSGLGHKIKKQRWVGYGDPSHISLYPAEKWLCWTEAAGFKILKTGTDGLWHVPYLPLIPQWVQKLIFYPLPAIQVITGHLFLPAGWGESLVVVAQKN